MVPLFTLHVCLSGFFWSGLDDGWAGSCGCLYVYERWRWVEGNLVLYDQNEIVPDMERNLGGISWGCWQNNSSSFISCTCIVVHWVNVVNNSITHLDSLLDWNLQHTTLTAFCWLLKLGGGRGDAGNTGLNWGWWLTPRPWARADTRFRDFSSKFRVKCGSQGLNCRCGEPIRWKSFSFWCGMG